MERCHVQDSDEFSDIGARQFACFRANIRRFGGKISIEDGARTIGTRVGCSGSTKSPVGATLDWKLYRPATPAILVWESIGAFIRTSARLYTKMGIAAVAISGLIKKGIDRLDAISIIAAFNNTDPVEGYTIPSPNLNFFLLTTLRLLQCSSLQPFRIIRKSRPTTLHGSPEWETAS